VRFLADESCDFAVVRALRVAGHEVRAVAELAPQASDDAVIELAHGAGMVLLTEDKDFGQLVYAELRQSAGVILIRFPALVRGALASSVVDILSRGPGEPSGRATGWSLRRATTGPGQDQSAAGEVTFIGPEHAARGSTERLFARGFSSDGTTSRS
jgi:predicted nuclease of predicted toxin-antitoxin system